MRITSTTFLLVIAIVLFQTSELRAASLSGKVIEVNGGDQLTVYNLNRPVKVRLLGVDAPEMSQAFGDVAKDHLSALVLNKFVTVENVGLGEHNTLVGKVLVEGRDVGAQMIRDGVAWFDEKNKSPLTDTDCEIYQESQRTAQNEKRGLWESPGAVPPWEFVKNEEIKRESVAKLVRSSNSLRAPKPTPELTNVSLMGGGASRTVARNFENRTAIWEAPRKVWQRLHPAGESFSVLVPVEGRQVTEPISSEQGTFDIHTYIVRDGYAFYVVQWINGPSRGERDVTILKSAVHEVLKGIAAGYSTIGISYACSSQSEQDISTRGYTGRDIDLTGCTVPTQMRIFTKAVDSKRQLYLAAVFYAQPEANVQKFLNSFNVGLIENSQPSTQKARTLNR